MGSGGGRGKTVAQQKLSGKSSIIRAKETMATKGTPRKSFSFANKAVSIATGKGSSGLLASAGSKATGVIGGILILAEKIASFGVNIYEADTGNEISSHNVRNTIATVSSLGMNYLSGSIQNELITKKTISRQNYSLDYGRELYDINVNGQKNKRY